MARPATKLRLRTLSYLDVLRDLDEMFGRDQGEVSFGARELFEYAKDGMRGKREPRELCHAMTARLYSAPARQLVDADPNEVVVGREAVRPMEIVLLAAETRAALEAGERVTMRGLAALASVHPHEIGRMVREGRLGHGKHDGRQGPPITPGAAARWLTTRGVSVAVQDKP